MASYTQPFAVGDRVVCIDASNGAHFLHAGHVYRVEDIQTDGNGEARLLLHDGRYSMAIMWETSRFQPA